MLESYKINVIAIWENYAIKSQLLINILADIKGYMGNIKSGFFCMLLQNLLHLGYSLITWVSRAIVINLHAKFQQQDGLQQVISTTQEAPIIWQYEFKFWVLLLIDSLVWICTTSWLPVSAHCSILKLEYQGGLPSRWTGTAFGTRNWTIFSF